jgi:hypothetical protein
MTIEPNYHPFIQPYKKAGLRARDDSSNPEMFPKPPIHNGDQAVADELWNIHQDRQIVINHLELGSKRFLCLSSTKQ